MSKSTKLKNEARFIIASSVYLFTFLAIVNYIHSDYPWILFCIPVLIIAPLAVAKPRRFADLDFAWKLWFSVSLYYLILNLVLNHLFMWAIIVSFVVLWYPFSLFFGKRHQYFAFSIFGLVWAACFFTTLNLMTTPHEIWAIYPIFAMIWWPLPLYFFKYKRVD